LRNKLFVFICTLFLFGCATHGDAPVIQQTAPIKTHCYPEAAKQFLRWNKSNGKELKGLTRRRNDEMNLFLKDCH